MWIHLVTLGMMTHLLQLCCEEKAPSLALADAAPPIEPVEVPQVRCLGSIQWIAHEKDLVYGNLLISFVCRNGMEWNGMFVKCVQQFNFVSSGTPWAPWTVDRAAG